MCQAVVISRGFVYIGCPLFSGLEARQSVLLTHGDSVEEVGEELEVVGRSSSIVVAVQHKTKDVFGLQFHPEVELSTHGKSMLKNFLYLVRCCAVDSL